ncbi:hypothetical protein ColTof4_01419 [Colletotrichum tofieldiae]|nr:hypothetical protein ColTof3_08676 [Colletotrichum tofieldiae]GKT68996.1 hypothetical protein ColTof4_01419 [Colletotrichum tofieldiae]GKT96861.1 hypothetical protein Ct61P_14711 [Colletotrichum tofieldiae]
MALRLLATRAREAMITVLNTREREKSRKGVPTSEPRCKCDHHERFGHLPFKTRATYRVWNRIGTNGGALAWLMNAAFNASNISERWALL